MKLLIDECLSPELAIMARDCGHVDSSHVTWIGKAGWKDWTLKQVILDGDWTLVTRNCIDFRGPADSPGLRGQFLDTSLHAGLICLNGPQSFDLDMQRELFAEALVELNECSDLVNRVLEVTMNEDATSLVIVRYDLPLA